MLEWPHSMQRHQKFQRSLTWINFSSWYYIREIVLREWPWCSEWPCLAEAQGHLRHLSRSLTKELLLTKVLVRSRGHCEQGLSFRYLKTQEEACGSIRSAQWLANSDPQWSMRHHPPRLWLDHLGIIMAASAAQDHQALSYSRLILIPALRAFSQIFKQSKGVWTSASF